MKNIVCALTIFVVLACIGLALGDAYPDSSEVKEEDLISSYSGTRQNRAGMNYSAD